MLTEAASRVRSLFPSHQTTPQSSEPVTVLGSLQRGIMAADQGKIGSISDFITGRPCWTTELSPVESQGSLKCKRVTERSQRGLRLWKTSEWWGTAGFEDGEMGLGTKEENGPWQPEKVRE